MKIARKKRCSPDVAHLDQSCGPPLQAPGKPAMWRHAVSECPEIGLVRLSCITAVGKSPLIVGVLMQPLATGHQLETAKSRSNEFVQYGSSGCGWV